MRGLHDAGGAAIVPGKVPHFTKLADATAPDLVEPTGDLAVPAGLSARSSRHLYCHL